MVIYTIHFCVNFPFYSMEILHVKGIFCKIPQTVAPPYAQHIETYLKISRSTCVIKTKDKTNNLSDGVI